MEGHLVRGNSLQQLEITDSRPTAGNLHRMEVGPLNAGDSGMAMAWAVCGASGSETRI